MQLIKPEAREVGQLLQDEDGAAEVEDVYVLQHPLEVDLLGGGACSTLRHAPAADGTRLQNGLDVSAGVPGRITHQKSYQTSLIEGQT